MNLKSVVWKAWRERCGCDYGKSQYEATLPIYCCEEGGNQPEVW